jgi:hypothetical protein
MTVSVSFTVDRFDPPGHWVAARSPRSYVSFHTLLHTRLFSSCVPACADTAKGLLRSASTSRIDSGCAAHESDTQLTNFEFEYVKAIAEQPIVH